MTPRDDGGGRGRSDPRGRRAFGVGHGEAHGARPVAALGGPVFRRRAVLLGGLAAAGALVGCTSFSSPLADASSAPSPTASPPPQPSPTPVLPRPLPPMSDVPGYALLPGEVEPACKQVAVDFMTAVMTTGTVATADVPLDVRIAAIGQPLAAAAPLLPLLPPGGASALEVVYPQYGGLSGDRLDASVMFVADHLVRPADAARPIASRRSTTVELLLSRRSGPWTVTEVRPAVLPPAAAAGPSAAASALLANDRVVLPAAARADVLGGGINDAVLAALAALSQRWQIQVQVLAAGHPVNIFGRNEVSNHTLGKAVDIWAIDGIPVTDRARSPWRDLMLAALDLGAGEVGGPEYVGDRRAFANATHQDHVHVGFPQAR